MKKALSIIMAIYFVCVYACTAFAVENTIKDDEMIHQGNEWFTVADIANDEAEMAYYYSLGLKEINMRRFARSNFYYIAVPKYFQNDPAWGNTLMPCGHSGHTYTEIGCPMTAYAMALKYYGNNVTPVDVAGTYQTNHRDCCDFRSAELVADYGRSRDLIQVSDRTFQNIATSIVGAIANDRPVIIKLNATSNGYHFVIAYGYSISSDGTTTISIHDPWAKNASASTLVGQYATLNAAYSAGRTAISIAIIK